MGLFKWLFGDSGPIESAATGALLGGAIGDRLDAADDRQQMIRLLKLKIAQDTYYHGMAESGRRIDFLEEHCAKEWAKIDAWQWDWHMPGVAEPIHDDFMRRWLRDAAFQTRNRILTGRWLGLFQDAVDVGIMPLIYMPRSKFGDVAGTEKTLSVAMDGVEQLVLQFQDLKQCEKDLKKDPDDPVARKALDDPKPLYPVRAGRDVSRVGEAKCPMLNTREAASILQLDGLYAICDLVGTGDLSDHNGEGFVLSELEALKPKIHILQYFDWIPDKTKKWEQLWSIRKDKDLRARRPAVMRDRGGV